MTHADVLNRPPAAAGGNALIDAMRRDWGAAYAIDVDLNGTWWALRRDGRRAVRGRLPVELLAGIIADYDACPVTDLDQLPRLEQLRREHPEVIILRAGPAPVAWLGLKRIEAASLREVLDTVEEIFSVLGYLPERAAPGSGL